LLLFVYLCTRQVFGLTLVGLDPETSLVWLWENRDVVELSPAEAVEQARSLYWLGDVNLAQLLIQYFGRSLFMATVFADLLVRMTLSVWGQEKQFQQTPEAAANDATMAELKRALKAEGS
jgi:hypothetical protein